MLRYGRPLVAAYPTRTSRPPGKRRVPLPSISMKNTSIGSRAQASGRARSPSRRRLDLGPRPVRPGGPRGRSRGTPKIGTAYSALGVLGGIDDGLVVARHQHRALVPPHALDEIELRVHARLEDVGRRIVGQQIEHAAEGRAPDRRRSRRECRRSPLPLRLPTSHVRLCSDRVAKRGGVAVVQEHGGLRGIDGDERADPIGTGVGRPGGAGHAGEHHETHPGESTHEESVHEEDSMCDDPLTATSHSAQRRAPIADEYTPGGRPAATKPRDR